MPPFNDEPFLKRQETLDAIQILATADQLVIYCGAGVTRDQTGLGWDQLVVSLYNEAKLERDEDKVVNTNVMHLLKSPLIAPQQKVSIAFEHLQSSRLGQPSGDFDERLARFFKKILYKDRGWGEGHLLKSVAGLAVQLALQGQPVTIVTTNYDDYLVEEIKRAIDTCLTATGFRPGLYLRAGTSKRNVMAQRPKRPAESITIYFIHGLIPNSDDDAVHGKLVFSENSYSDTQPGTAKFLRGLMSDKTSWLIIGASLTDPPLIQALREGRSKGGRVIAINTLPSGLWPGQEGPRPSEIQDALARRLTHIGVSNPLSAANFGQVAQFVEEIRICSAFSPFRDVLGDGQYIDFVSYPARLKGWWENWQSSASAQNHTRNHEIMSMALKAIRDHLEQMHSPPSSGEHLKLELWLRLNPSVSSDHRALTLIANSIGPILDIPCRREERITRESTAASVRSFLDGKPVLLQLDDLGHSGNASRWKTFLSSPLFYLAPDCIPRDNDVLPVTFRGIVPVGVVTLTSTYGSHFSAQTGHAQEACFTSSKVENTDYVKMLSIMIEAGRKIASPDAID